MANREIFDAKPPTDTKIFYFDFTSNLAVGETISTQTVSATVWSGTDATPSNIISGSASASGAIVSQKITAGTLGVTYTILCTITTSLGQTLTQAGYLAIVKEATQ
jgi:hypothetical protein